MSGIDPIKLLEKRYREILSQFDFSEIYSDKHLSGIGRRKLIVPLYKSLITNGKKEWAQSVYLKARPGYHPLAQGTIDALFDK